MKTISLITILFIFIGCSGKPQTTNARISLGAINSGTDFPGGLFLMMHNRGQNTTSLQKLDDTEITIELEDGLWQFGAIGFLGNSKLQGEVNCFITNDIRLEGNEVDVNLSLSKSGCEREPFYNSQFFSGNPSEPNKIEIVSCGLLNMKNPSDIDSSELCDDHKGIGKSFKLIYYEFPFSTPENRDSVKTNRDETACINFDGGHYLSGLNSPFQIPAMRDVPLSIEVFTESNCGGEKSFVHFDRGLNEPISNINSELAIVTKGNDTLKILVNSHVCNNTFANYSFSEQNTNYGLTGAATAPYYICNENQFFELNSHLSAHANIANHIDFGGDGNNFLTNDFNGTLNGNNFILSNFVYTGSPGNNFGLFSKLTAGANIQNLHFQNFQITSNSNVNVGILSGQTQTFGGDINLSNITFDFQSFVTTMNGTAGALTGDLDNSSSSSSVSIKNIMSSANITSLSASTNPIGGLIGKAYTATPMFAQTIVHDSEVYNAIISMNTGSTSGNSATGGIVGDSNSVHYYKARYLGGPLNSIINAPTKVGGIIGHSQSDIVIACQTDFKINSNNDSQIGFGGIVGISTPLTGTNSGFTDNIAKVKVEPSISNNTAIAVGGILGQVELTTPSAKGIVLRNNKVDISTLIDGQKHGGLIGDEQDLDAGNNFYAQGNVIYANLLSENKASITNSYKGALSGYSSGGKYTRNIIHAKIDGADKIGGLIGQMVSTNKPSEIEEAYAKVDIEVVRGGTSIFAGGAVGYFSNTSILKNSKIEGSLFVNENVNCDGTPTLGNFDYCGLLIGYNNTSTAIDISDNISLINIIADTNTNGINDDSTIGSPEFCLNYNLIHTRSYSTDDNATINTHSLLNNGPWVGNWTSGDVLAQAVTEPLFFYKHKTLGTLANMRDLDGNGSFESPDFLGGSILEPLNLRTKSDWNSIGSDAYLLSKSFAITNDIYFDNLSSEFIPFGGKGALAVDQFFTGRIFSYGGSLNNILIDSSEYTDNHPLGIIRVLGSSTDKGYIGEIENPIRINNITIDINDTQNSSVGTVAGQSIDGQVSAIINNANIEVNSGLASDIGGIIGNSPTDSQLNLYNSSFTGSIKYNSGTAQNIGGLVGLIAGGTALNIEVINNAIKIDEIAGSTGATGGLIGNFNGGTSGAKTVIKSNYVYFKPNSLFSPVADPEQAGFIGTYTTSAITEVHNNFVDISHLTTPPSANTRFFISSGTSSGSALKNFVVVGPHGNAGNTGMVEASYMNYFDILLASSSNIGLLGGSKDNAFFYDLNGTETNFSDDSVKLFWEYQSSCTTAGVCHN